jgi:hypothetical protein
VISSFHLQSDSLEGKRNDGRIAISATQFIPFERHQGVTNLDESGRHFNLRPTAQSQRQSARNTRNVESLQFSPLVLPRTVRTSYRHHCDSRIFGLTMTTAQGELTFSHCRKPMLTHPRSTNTPSTERSSVTVHPRRFLSFNRSSLIATDDIIFWLWAEGCRRIIPSVQSGVPGLAKRWKEFGVRISEEGE